jgi:hypothetical protein
MDWRWARPWDDGSLHLSVLSHHLTQTTCHHPPHNLPPDIEGRTGCVAMHVPGMCNG